MAQLIHQEFKPRLGYDIRPFLVERLVVLCLGNLPDPSQGIGVAAIRMHQPPVLSGLGVHFFEGKSLRVTLGIAQGNIEIRNELKIHNASSKSCESGCKNLGRAREGANRNSL